MTKLVFVSLIATSFLVSNLALALNENPSLDRMEGFYKLDEAYKGRCPETLKIELSSDKKSLSMAPFFKFEAIGLGVKKNSKTHLFTKSYAREYPSRLEVTFLGTQAPGFHRGDYLRVSLYKKSLEIESGIFEDHAYFEGMYSMKSNRFCVYDLTR